MVPLNFRYDIFKIVLVINDQGISREIVLRLMSLDLPDDESTLVQVMAWCPQAKSHYLKLFVDPGLFHHMSSLGHSERTWDTTLIYLTVCIACLCHSFNLLGPNDTGW